MRKAPIFISMFDRNEDRFELHEAVFATHKNILG